MEGGVEFHNHDLWQRNQFYYSCRYDELYISLYISDEVSFFPDIFLLNNKSFNKA